MKKNYMQFGSHLRNDIYSYLLKNSLLKLIIQIIKKLKKLVLLDGKWNVNITCLILTLSNLMRIFLQIF
ncbi:hypothetical protein ACS0TY_006390 [Phlomoides rotata]